MPAGAHRDVAVPRGGEVQVVCALKRGPDGRSVNVAADPKVRAEIAGAVGELRVATLRRELAREFRRLPDKVMTKAGETAAEDFYLYLVDWAGEKTEGRPDEHAKKLERALARLRQVAAETPCGRPMVGDVHCNLTWRHGGECEWRAPAAPAQAPREIAPSQPPRAATSALAPRSEIAPAPARPAPPKGPAPMPPADPKNPWGLPAAAAPALELGPCFRCNAPATELRTVRGRPDVPVCSGCVEAARAARQDELWPRVAELQKHFEAEAQALRGHLERALLGIDVLSYGPLRVRRAEARTLLLAWAGEGADAGEAVARLREALSWAWEESGEAEKEIDRLAARLGPRWAKTIAKMRRRDEATGAREVPLWHTIPTLHAAALAARAGDVPEPPKSASPPAELPPLPGPGEPDALGFREGALGPPAPKPAAEAPKGEDTPWAPGVRCACVHPDGYECMRRRDSRALPFEDDARREQLEDDCDCVCHERAREAEEDGGDE